MTWNARSVGRASRAGRRPYSPPGPAVLVCLYIAQALIGCDTGAGDRGPAAPVPTVPPPVSSPPSPVTQKPWHGYFTGTIAIDSQDRAAEAILTVDGRLRIYVIGHAGYWTDPGGTIQVVSQVELDGNEAAGTGFVLAEACAAPEQNRFCGDAAAARISIARSRTNRMSGEIRVTTQDGLETWLVDMRYYGGSYPGAYYDYPAGTFTIAGTYKEELAEFADSGDVILNVDSTGDLFFQSPDNGCTGNGKITPHLDGQFSVYDVTLTIANCIDENAYLNGEFHGLAIHMPPNPWDYGGFWLRMWLSTPPGIPIPAALTLWASPQ